MITSDKINLDFDPSNRLYCNAWVATAIVGSAVIGAATTAYTANKAADSQRAAADKASQTQLTAADKSNQLLADQYRQTREDLSPYRNIGDYGIEELKKRPDLLNAIQIPQEMLDLRKPLEFTQEELEKLPGYQFALTQGTKAAQNSAAARGLGVSGAALKGATTFAKGLADSTFTNYFGQQQQNVQNAFSRYDTTLGRQIQQQGTAFDRLKGLIDTGAGAAGATAKLGTDTAVKQSGNITDAAKGVASNTIGAGNADAAAINTTGQGINKAVDNIGGYAAYTGLYGRPNGSNMNYVTGSAGDYAVPTYGR